MKLRFIVQTGVLLCASPAFAQSVYRVEFPQDRYDVSPSQEFKTSVKLSPVPASGLFSYGLVCTVRGDNGLAGIVTMAPSSTLAFDGVIGSGNRGVTAETGKYSAKGSVDILLPQKENHVNQTLGDLRIAGLPEGTYSLDLALYNTLGPTESIFVDGQSHSLDPELSFGSAVLAVISSGPSGTIVPFGSMVPDRQTGLLVQQYDVKNTGSTAAVFRILVRNLPDASRVWNAQGKVGGIPYIDLPQMLAVGATTRITIEYFSQDRSTIPNPTFELIATSEVSPAPEGVTSTLKPRAMLSGGNALLEFNSEAGKSYYIQYSSDMRIWKTALPKIEGTGNRIQWIDNGSPKTDSSPLTASSRFYRILATQTAP